MYTHVSKCKNNKNFKKELSFSGFPPKVYKIIDSHNNNEFIQLKKKFYCLTEPLQISSFISLEALLGVSY
jgi:hypothetical protein